MHKEICLPNDFWWATFILNKIMMIKSNTLKKKEMILNYRLLWIFLVAVATANISQAQSLDHCLGEYIVKLKPGKDINQFINSIQVYKGLKTNLSVKANLMPGNNVWLLSIDPNRINELEFKDELFSKSDIEVVQFNKLIQLRATPNDEQFPDQWQFINDGMNGDVADADFDADLAWDITTGGLTPNGDTIVVAVLDDGLDTDHEDFGDNLWVNHAEIDGNGIDDDGNGFVDDYLGFNSNASASNGDIDRIEGGGHGTPVAGIIGAQGNNEIGVTGINWDVKLMIIKNDFSTDEANVLRAYGYAYAQRILYNETNGQEGAFVVATNASWGIDFGQADDAPIWCSFYDDMGEAGIISCGATINGNVNVDEEGDLPTTCTSDYLISVTNMASNNEKVTGAGFGPISIDLGAYGASTFTTGGNNNYIQFGGTSGATPFVTGTVALLYSAPCPNLTMLSRTNPGAAALFVKQYILDGVKPNPSLEGITVTEGVLNVNNSVNLLMDDCNDCSLPRTLIASESTDTETTLDWVAFNSALTVNLQWRETGTQIWNTNLNVDPPYLLNGLTACTEYEFQVEAICSGTTSGYSEIVTFKTDGCCEPPKNIQQVVLDQNNASVIWDEVLLSTGYDFRYRALGTTEWTVQAGLTSTTYNLSDLDGCTEYEYQILTLCVGNTTDWSAPTTFTTKGCGACFDLEYCESFGNNSQGDYIMAFTINGISNNSGNNGGYANFEDLGIRLNQSGVFSFSLLPGFDSGGPYPEHFKIWIDFDHNGAFENNELVFDPGRTIEEETNGFITIPSDATLGITKLRVALKWTGNFNGDSPPEACESGFDFGETEDYCVEIIEPSAGCISDVSDFVVSEIFQNSASFDWSAIGNSDRFIFRWRELGESEWEEVIVNDPGLIITSLQECTAYECEVQAVCENALSNIESDSFITECVNSTKESEIFRALTIQPTIFQDHIEIHNFDGNSNNVDVEIFDVQGHLKAFDKENITISNEKIRVDNLNNLSTGVYFISIISEGQQFMGKAIKL